MYNQLSMLFVFYALSMPYRFFRLFLFKNLFIKYEKVFEQKEPEKPIYM